MKPSPALPLSLIVASTTVLAAAEFHPPVALGTEAGLAMSESPGYASPCLADIDGDGKEELLVGQFAGGNIAVYEIGDLSAKKAQLTKQSWLMIEGKRAEVPGVW